MVKIPFPPKHALAYNFFKTVALILANYGIVNISSDEAYITIEDLSNYCNELVGLCTQGKPLWYSMNDRRYILSKLRSYVKSQSDSVSDLIKAYTNRISGDGESVIGEFERIVVTSPSTLKATLYEHRRGYGVSTKEEVKLSLNQLILSILGASISKLGFIRERGETKSFYLLPISGQDISTYVKYVNFLRRLPVDIPYSIKHLYLALKALDLQDASDEYGIEYIVSERGNRATVISSHYLSSSGLAYSLMELTLRLEKQVNLLKWCLNTLIKIHIGCRDAEDEASRLSKAIESFCEYILCYVNTGSLDYKYNALSSLKRILDDDTALLRGAFKLGMEKDEIMKALSSAINLLSYMRSSVERILL